MIVALIVFVLGIILGHIYGSHTGYMAGVEFAAKEIYGVPEPTLDR